MSVSPTATPIGPDDIRPYISNATDAISAPANAVGEAVSGLLPDALTEGLEQLRKPEWWQRLGAWVLGFLLVCIGVLMILGSTRVVKNAVQTATKVV